MAKKWKTIAITQYDWRLLKAMSQILGKPQAQVLGDYIWALAPCVSQYEKATILFDNSKVKLSDSEQVLIIKISGTRKFLEVEENV